MKSTDRVLRESSDSLTGSRIKCKRCGRGIPTPIYRLSPKGGPFEGACWNCLTPEERERVDPEVRRINELLGGK